MVQRADNLRIVYALQTCPGSEGRVFGCDAAPTKVQVGTIGHKMWYTSEQNNDPTLNITFK